MKKNIRDIRVLIVDDNAVNRKVLSLSFKKYQVEILEAENGKVAFDFYKEKSFDLVLMDIMMPVWDGIESVKAIRAFEVENDIERSKIYAISANIQEEEFDHLYKIGFDKISKKPLNFKMLEGWLQDFYDF